VGQVYLGMPIDLVDGSQDPRWLQGVVPRLVLCLMAVSVGAVQGLGDLNCLCWALQTF
jgi:hypothetical protein